ncbi:MULTISPECIES: type II secretion system protein GspM [Salinivibrio]|jgi:Type II secretory pathway, component PulM|uniref:type II secretion system protein GspM n=1 Tax=Salinivibrio TaxID=51366 RepID=UPI000395D1CC|nr:MULTISPECIES: type II secretion system protein M [Salinivibrio]NUY57085.1 type II secretion system protein M [Salinivibrio sp. EAGSL]
MMARIQAQWQAISVREQRLLLIAGGVLVVSLLYWGVIAPLQTQAEKANTALASEQRLLRDVQQKRTQIMQLRAQSGSGHQASASRTQPLNQVIAASAGEFNLTITRLQPGEDSVQLGIEPLPFNQLLRWLDQLASVHGIRVVRLSTEATETAGKVKVNRLQLER